MNSKNILGIINGLTNIIFFMILLYMTGDAGAGLYICAYLVYKVLYVLLVGGIRASVAKFVSQRRYRGMYDGAKNYFRYNLFFCLITSLIVGALLFILADSISTLLFGNAYCGILLQYLCLYFLLHSVNDCLCGYYLGCNNGTLVFIGEIVYGVVSCVCAPFIIKAFTNYGNKVYALLKNPIVINSYGVTGGVTAMCIAAFISMLVLIIGARGRIKKGKNLFFEGRGESKKGMLRYILLADLENAKNKLFPYLLMLAISIVYMINLGKTDIELVDLYGAFGAFGSKLGIFILLQDTLYGEFVNVHKSRIRLDYKRDEIKNFTSSVNSLLKSTIILLLPMVCSVMCYHEGINEVYFNSSVAEGSTIVTLCGICLLFNGIDLSLKAILMSSGYSKSSSGGELVGFAVGFIYTIVWGLMGNAVSGLIYGVMLALLSSMLIHAFVVFRGFSIRLNDLLQKFVTAAIASLVLSVLDMILARFLNMNLLILTLCIICGYVIYVISLMALRGVNSRDIKALKGSLLYYPINFLSGLFGVR